MTNRRLVLACDGVRAEAELLDDNAPKAAEAVWAMLPITDEMFAAKWSGNAAVIHPGPGPVQDVTELENPVTSVYPGAIVMRPRGSEILLGHGVGEYRWAVGVDYVVRIGKIVTNRSEFLAVLRRTETEGPRRLVLSRAD
jgi:hypothetical protein